MDHRRVVTFHRYHHLRYLLFTTLDITKAVNNQVWLSVLISMVLAAGETCALKPEWPLIALMYLLVLISQKTTFNRPVLTCRVF